MQYGDQAEVRHRFGFIVEFESEVLFENQGTKAPSPFRPAGALQNSIRKPMLLAITMQQLFEKAFVTKSGQIV